MKVVMVKHMFFDSLNLLDLQTCKSKHVCVTKKEATHSLESEMTKFKLHTR